MLVFPSCGDDVLMLILVTSALAGDSRGEVADTIVNRFEKNTRNDVRNVLSIFQEYIS